MIDGDILEDDEDVVEDEKEAIEEDDELAWLGVPWVPKIKQKWGGFASNIHHPLFWDALILRWSLFGS